MKKKMKHANCGASVKAATGGYMQVGQAKKKEGTGYNKGGMVEESQKVKESDRSKYAKRAEGIKASKGGAVKKKAFKPCKGCPTPSACAKAGKCKGKK